MLLRRPLRFVKPSPTPSKPPPSPERWKEGIDSSSSSNPGSPSPLQLIGRMDLRGDESAREVWDGWEMGRRFVRVIHGEGRCDETEAWMGIGGGGGKGRGS